MNKGLIFANEYMPLGGLEPTTPKSGDIKILLINLDISKVMRTFAA